MNPVNRCKKEHVGAEKDDLARQTQAIISRGEDLLFRAHEIAHDIEEHIRQVLNRTQSDVSN